MDSIRVARGDRGGTRPPLVLPSHLMDESVLLSDEARTGGMFLMAPTGWGKSRFLGAQCYQDLLRGVGTVVLDAVGGTIDNLLNKLLYLPEKEQKELSEKIVYCNMAGYRVGDSSFDTYVTAWPMLYKLDEKETLDVTSQRIVDLISKTNKALASASIQGLPRVEAILTSVLQILAAHNLPISCAIDLLQNPEKWRGKIEEAVKLHPEVIRARNRLIEDFLDLPRKQQQSQSEVILNRLQRIEFDAVAEAMFSTPKPLIDWDDVVDNGKQVLIDLRYEKSDKARELKLFWVWGSIYEYIKSREANGRERPPLSLVIDELSYFVRGNSINRGVITEEFRQLIQVYKRNSNIWFTAATQEVGELPSELGRACLKTATHMYGAIDNPDFAKKLARRRRWGPAESSLITPEDLQISYAQRLQELKKGQWLVGVSPNEGELPTHFERIQTDHVDDRMFVQKKLVDELKRHLMERDGVLVSDILPGPRKQKGPKETPSTEARDKDRQDEFGAGEPYGENGNSGRLRRRAVESI